MSDEALKRRLTDFICEVPMPRFLESGGVINIVADDLAGWLAVFIRDEAKPLTAVADAARKWHDCTAPDTRHERAALGDALDALDGEQG